MKNGNRRRHLVRLSSVFLISAFILAVAVLAVPFYSVRSSSLPTRGNSQTSDNSAKAAKLSKTASLALFSPALFAPLSSIFKPLVPTPPAPEGIATFNGDCITPQSDFFLGDVVCAKATGVPATVFPWRVLWIDTAGFVRQSNDASTDETTEYRYTLPTTATSDVNGQTVDNRGTWKVNLVRSNGAVRQTARFTVHETANPVADVFIQKFVHSASASVPSGENISFTLVVGNDGPDPAAAIHLIDSVPSGGTLVQFTQNSGSPCVAVETGVPNNCIMAALTNGDRAEFTAIYNTGTAAPGDYETSATVSSTTTDPNAGNNTSTAQFSVTPSTGTATCQLICPDNITAPANTTEGGQRGAHVNYPPPVSSGDCGSVTSTPPSGSFFPVGQNVVTATSETGGGSCTFTVTVEEHGSAATISCPSNQTANADNNCQATVNVGSPTVTGDNVTVFATRSDGQPMYDCDGNGNCTRRTQDAPFSAGVTTITWTATSHDIAGPYASVEDEQAHRTGTASCTQTVTVNDVTPPVIAATDQTVSADANCQATVPDYSSTVSDNCACSNSDTSESCVGHPHFTVTQDPAPGTVVGPGQYPVHITANDNSSNNDGAGNTTEKTITFTVKDTTPPTITCPANMTSNTLPGTCSAVVVVGIATASDNCDTLVVPTGTRSDGQPILDPLYPKGTTTITWTATDNAGNQSSCTQTITVVDNEPPTITFNGQTPSMWPPNHSYHTFTAADFISSVSDNCDTLSVSDVDIIMATSDELENGGGDGNTLNDIVIATNCKSIQLRAERVASGNGRVYTITFRLRDHSGNTTTGTAKVYSPKNQGQTPVDDGPHYTVTGNCP
jgi:uncharacterized repeat protein (TIGR01451 family)